MCIRVCFDVQWSLIKNITFSSVTILLFARINTQDAAQSVYLPSCLVQLLRSRLECGRCSFGVSAEVQLVTRFS